MNQAKKLSGLSLATAAATMLLAGVSSTAIAGSHGKEKAAEIKCSGINSCKGTSACMTADSACAGQNSCKGKGWIKASAADCKTKGGKEVETKAM